jgi:hypothetical protein
LTKKHGSNLNARGIVRVAGTGLSTPDNFTDPLKASGCLQGSGANSDLWFSFDFGGSTIIPTHYTLQACSPNQAPKSWTLDVSVDGTSWEVIHSVDNSEVLRLQNAIQSFPVSPAKPVRFLRLRQRANLAGTTNIHLKSFEVFGRLIE